MVLIIVIHTYLCISTTVAIKLIYFLVKKQPNALTCTYIPPQSLKYLLFCQTYAMSSVLKLTILEMKLSLIMMPLMAFQSTSGSPRRRQIASRACLTRTGGLGRARTSARCCFFIDFTAMEQRGQKSVQIIKHAEEKATSEYIWK